MEYIVFLTFFFLFRHANLYLNDVRDRDGHHLRGIHQLQLRMWWSGPLVCLEDCQGNDLLSILWCHCRWKLYRWLDGRSGGDDGDDALIHLSHSSQIVLYLSYYSLMYLKFFHPFVLTNEWIHLLVHTFFKHRIVPFYVIDVKIFERNFEAFFPN